MFECNLCRPVCDVDIFSYTFRFCCLLDSIKSRSGVCRFPAAQALQGQYMLIVVPTSESPTYLTSCRPISITVNMETSSRFWHPRHAIAACVHTRYPYTCRIWVCSVYAGFVRAVRPSSPACHWTTMVLRISGEHIPRIGTALKGKNRSAMFERRRFAEDLNVEAHR